MLTLFAIVAWSVFLSWFWGVGRISAALFTSFGIHVGASLLFVPDWKPTEVVPHFQCASYSFQMPETRGRRC